MTSTYSTRTSTAWVLPLLLWASTVTVASPTHLLAQDRWFPAETYFARPQAAPREPTFALRGLWTDLFVGRDNPRERSPFEFDEPASNLEREAQGEAVLGGTVRIWRAASWDDGGVTLGLSSAVFGRFRLEISSSDLVASDWIVTLPVEARRGPWSGRVQILHWSAHLGDEMIEKAGAERIDFTHNGVALLLARDLGDFRLYGGASRLSRSSLENEEQLPAGFSDDAAVQLGAEALWAPWESALRLEGGIDFQAADRTDWSGQWSLTGGLRIQDGVRSVQLHGMFFDGPSTLGQFFWTDERAWGFELVIEL